MKGRCGLLTPTPAYLGPPEQDIVRSVVSVERDRFDHFAEVLHRLISSDAVSSLVGALPKRVSQASRSCR